MQFLASMPDYDDDVATKAVWSRLDARLKDIDGICYYKHPILSSAANSVPDLTLLARNYEPIAIRCLHVTVEEVESISDQSWKISGALFPSPLLELDDYLVGLEYLFKKERDLRHLFDPISVIALPLIAKSDFERAFRENLGSVRVLWSDLDIESVLAATTPLDDRLWKLCRSIFQGVNPLNRPDTNVQENTNLIGGAIRTLEKEIALLDEEQHKVAIQIAPGPQRIRGLAGTGKTVVLAMKAANIHLRFPEKRILFTFNTQSLYNQAKALITKFYRVHSDHDPDWEKLHVLHAWGGQGRNGVYSEACKLNGLRPLTYSDARALGSGEPLAIACKKLMDEREIAPFYDYILVDEAQDFPSDFFRLLYHLCSGDKCIFWAYDELQNLTAVEVPTPTQLFGVDELNQPLISLDGEDYPGEIEKDFVLHRSYRCPLGNLMLAHGIGLGIHSPRGCVQMLSTKSSWESLGYEIQQGQFHKDDEMVILRPEVNSPNRIAEIYQGAQNILDVQVFNDREQEYDWVVQSIAEDIRAEKVREEQIVVISLDSVRAKTHLATIQAKLFKRGISSTIPGLVDAASDFAEAGMVTLSTVHRAKGNEAPVVYIIAFDFMSQYAEEIDARNRAFTSISRSKGWVRITGCGKEMAVVKKEIDKIRADLPFLKFRFPDMDKIRRLDASETSRRRNEVKKAKELVRKFKGIDKGALGALDQDDLQNLRELLNELTDETD